MTGYIPEFAPQSTDSLGGAGHTVPKFRSGYFYLAKHFAVMVALMYAGMFVLDPLYDLGAALAGVGDPWGRLPLLSNVVMALNMSIPMVVYMRHQRHTWRPIGEMSAAMLLPAALTMGPYLLGIITAGTMMALSHAAMFPLMAVAMILRFREYACDGRCRTARGAEPSNRRSQIHGGRHRSLYRRRSFNRLM